MTEAAHRWIGIDVAKATLDVQVRPTDQASAVTNDEAGIRTLLEHVRAVAPTLIVLEATGGYELAVTSALAAAALPVVVVNPRHVRDFAKATGRLAKTDRLDAALLARFAEQVQPTARLLATDDQRELDALLTRRRQLIEMLTAEKHRLGQVVVKAGKRVKKSHGAHHLSRTRTAHRRLGLGGLHFENWRYTIPTAPRRNGLCEVSKELNCLRVRGGGPYY